MWTQARGIDPIDPTGPTDPVEDLRLKLNSVGLNVPYLITNGLFHRVGTADKPHKFNGAYRCIMDGALPYVLWWNWAQDPDSEDGKGVIPLIPEGKMTKEQRKYFADRAAQDREEFEAWQAKGQAIAKSKAQKIWESLPQASAEHTYFVHKGITYCQKGIKLSGNNRLVVPIVGKNIQGKDEVQSLLFIDAQGQKRFLKGGKKQGGHFFIGLQDDLEKPLCIAEGLSTALSIYMATQYPCIMAFDVYNLGHVARMARQYYPSRKLIICADNDHGGAHE